MYAIETKKLTKRFKDKLAVDGIDLRINEGELFALLGVNGAGKTTTIKMLSGLIKSTDGDALVGGYSINTEISKVKDIIAVSPQETAVARNLSVYENLEFIAEIHGYRGDLLQSKIKEMIDIFHFEEVLKKKAKTLSGGWQRKLSIAMALISSPQILFLDEPTLGLDVLASRELRRIITNLKGKITIILTTHYMDEAETLADRVGIISKGKMLAVDSVNELITKTSSKNLEDAFVKIATEEY